jgi:manganese efflux pump family protein
VRIGVAFGLFEGLMPIVGIYIGRALATVIGGYGRYGGAGLLVLTGVYTIWQARRTRRAEERGKGVLSTRELYVIAFALSIDNLVVGFALGVLAVPVPLSAVVIAAVSIALSLLGLELGRRAGERLEEWSEEIGGAVLILVGVAIAVGVLG